jgi:hypothetical protein
MKKMTVNTRPTAERIMPAVARPLEAGFLPRKPRMRPTILRGPPQNQPTEAHNERIPRIREAIARPLPLTGAGVETYPGTGAVAGGNGSDMGTGAGTGGSWSDIITPFGKISQ